MPPTNNIRSLLSVSRKKITDPHAPAAYNVSRSAIDAFPGDVVRFNAQVISTQGTPVLAANRTGSWIIVTGSGGTLSAATGTTNAQGVAQVDLTVGSVVGTVYRVKFIDSDQLTGTSPNLTIVADPDLPPVVPVPPPIIVPPVPPDPVINPPTATDATLPTLLTTTVASTPSPGTLRSVAAGADLQAVLDAALPGDIIELDRTGTWDGNYRFPEKSGGIAGTWITIRTNGLATNEGVQMTPTYVGAHRLPKIRSLSVQSGFRTDLRAKKWRVIGVEITNHPTLAANNTWGLVAIGDGGDFQFASEDVAEDIIYDRCYIHGDSTFDCRRGVSMNGRRAAVIDSWVDDIHSTFDAQAIGGWNGPGPFKIVNNELRGSGEVIAFGGADPRITGLVPSDIEIRRNHLNPDPAWKGTWVLKNLIEFKAGRRVLIEGNVGENGIPDGQAGYAVVLQSVNAQGTSPTSITEHVTIRYNVWRNCASWFQLNAHDFPSDRAHAPNANHITIRHNVGIGIDNPTISISQGRLFQIVDKIDQLTIEHNTAFSRTGSSFIWTGERPLNDHIVRNNLVGGGQYQLFGSGGNGKAAWDAEAGPGSAFEGNVVVDGGSNGQAPIPNNSYPGAFADVGFVGGGSAATSLTASLADLTLASDSAYKHAATDGTDPGADMALVAAAVAGVGGF